MQLRKVAEDKLLSIIILITDAKLYAQEVSREGGWGEGGGAAAVDWLTEVPINNCMCIAEWVAMALHGRQVNWIRCQRGAKEFRSKLICPFKLSPPSSPKQRRHQSWICTGIAFLCCIITLCYLWVNNYAPGNNNNSKAKLRILRVINITRVDGWGGIFGRSDTYLTVE